MSDKMLCCVVEHVEPDKAGKATELGIKYSSFGVSGGFFPPFMSTNVDF